MTPTEVNKLINDGVFECTDDINGIIRDGGKLVTHRCNTRCLVCVSPGCYHCGKINNVSIFTENTKHGLKPLQNDYSSTLLY